MHNFYFPTINNIFSNEASQNFKLYLEGLKYFLDSNIKRKSSDHKVIAELGSTKLLDCRKNKEFKHNVIFVPSLINKSYILDLMPERSLVNHLYNRNVGSFIIDWDEPNVDELSLNFHDYIERVISLVKETYIKTREKVSIAGYCLGGVLTIAAYPFIKDYISSISLIATPWDFKVYKDINANFAITIPNYDIAIEGVKKIPPHYIKHFFELIDPYRTYNKFIDFAKMDKNSIKAQVFLAVEGWSNDGISLTRPVYDFLFNNLINNNCILNKKFVVNEKVVDLDCIDKPCMITVSLNDKIVPPSSSYPLIEQLKDAKFIYSPTGHIGMIIGSNAENIFWNNFAEWVILNS